MNEPCLHEVSSPQIATTLLVDLRNFTPNLNAAKEDERGINMFCHFLSEFYALCLDASLIALPSNLRQRPPLYMSSTGDGVLVLFIDGSHVKQGFLTALLLHTVLRSKCELYNSRFEKIGCPKTSFGIGVESGSVSRIRAYAPSENPHPIVDTWIGPSINVAARAESVSKTLHNANTIISETTNELLCKELFDESYDDLIHKAYMPKLEDSERLTIHDRMNDLNRKLCLSFIHHHNLKGVDRPTPLFRIADSTAYLGNPRFDALVSKLTEGSAHLLELADFLSQHTTILNT